MIEVSEDIRVLDPCCGSRMFWFDKNNPETLFGDIRREEHILCDGRALQVNPDVIIDFRSLPIADGTFALVVLDPPHFRSLGKTSWMAKKYGVLPLDWKDGIAKGFAECFRVLKEDGVLIFKWNAAEVAVREVLSLTPNKPLFGHPTFKGTHWFTFIKPKETA